MAMTARLTSTTERWHFEPPEPADRFLIHWLHSTVTPEGVVSLSAQGVPVSKHGKIVGGISYRYLPDHEMRRLHALVLEEGIAR